MKKNRNNRNPASKENVTTVEKGDIGRLIVGPIRKRKKMKSTTYL